MYETRLNGKRVHSQNSSMYTHTKTHTHVVHFSIFRCGHDMGSIQRLIQKVLEQYYHCSSLTGRFVRVAVFCVSVMRHWQDTDI